MEFIYKCQLIDTVLWTVFRTTYSLIEMARSEINSFKSSLSERFIK